MEVWGPYALFTRPEFKVERFTYDVMTPSAARGIVEAVYWHPGIRYVIDAIDVLNPIRFQSIKRNEVALKASGSDVRTAMRDGTRPLPTLNPAAKRQQHTAIVLCDVRYVIEFHFELDEAHPEQTPEKTAAIIGNRMRKGKCYCQPYLGCREFSAFFREWPGDKPVVGAYNGTGERDFGFMVYDLDYEADPIAPLIFRAVMVDGRIDTSMKKVLR